jgi:hypothetical protein
VFPLVVNVKIEEPEPVIGVWLKAPVVPVGSPETLSATLPLNAFNEFTNIFG